MKIKSILLTTLSMLAVNFSAQAGLMDGYNDDWSTGYYGGIGATTTSQFTMDLDSTMDVFGNTDPNAAATKQTSTGAGIDLFLGRKISRFFGVEADFTWLDLTSFKVIDSTGAKLQTIDIKDQWNLNLATVFYAPLTNNFNAYAKLGAGYFQTKQRYTEVATNIKTIETAEAFAMTYGLGLQYTYNQFGIRAGYTVVRPDESIRDDFYVADIVYASFVYTFI